MTDQELEPLAYAVRSGDILAVDSLIGKDNEYINVKDSKGSTPLHLAVQCDNPNMVQFLILNGADLNAQNVLGQTPLHFAAIKSSQPVFISMALEKEANIYLKDKKGRSPYSLADEHKRQALARILIKNDRKPKAEQVISPLFNEHISQKKRKELQSYNHSNF
ncbi:ankyrin repeat domain-containing protein [Thiotrichales bacterium 19S3-7]|nr:ankyrin repeat domain-containing protein [Thiotrichales bacterium 19S3-7]MCF6802412.1 ankyrin repeat domain-containing protein [Thiotrichales bacterium 19S3-11]